MLIGLKLIKNFPDLQHSRVKWRLLEEVFHGCGNSDEIGHLASGCKNQLRLPKNFPSAFPCGESTCPVFAKRAVRTAFMMEGDEPK